MAERHGAYNATRLEEAYRIISEVLCREYGFLRLPSKNYSSASCTETTENFLLTGAVFEQVLDVIELSFRWAKSIQGDDEESQKYNFRVTIREAEDELNQRFREHGIGYQLESGNIFRVDSQLIHSEVVKPALSMLNHPLYEGANEEFLKAHEHYRHKNYKECLNECLKAFESTMKSICDKRGWAYDGGANASRLIAVCFDNELVPPFLQTQFNSLKSTLESGVPTARNKLGGHGQGAQTVNVPEYLASYALHLTATNILFLVKAEEDLA